MASVSPSVLLINQVDSMYVFSQIRLLSGLRNQTKRYSAANGNGGNTT
jgi:uncharacterized membrane protein